jgi:diadenosine tetraphosphate (Ap4A) HIT family hydrolase
MPGSKNYVLWENERFSIHTPANPHIPYSEGLHLTVMPKHEIAAAWENPALAAETFGLAAKACAIMKGLELAPWFNIQANGNWGLLPGNSLFFHIHVYGRNKTESWAKPIVLPEAPGTYSNQPMPAKDRTLLIETFKSL